MNNRALFLALLVALCCFQRSVMGGQEVPPADVRHAKLLNALQSDDWFVRRRALQELTTGMQVENSRWEPVVNRLLALPANDAQFDSFIVLSGAGAAVLPALVAGLERKSAEQSGESLLICFGRMKAAAAPVIPRLTAMVEQPKLDAETKASIRVVLANAGYQSAQNIGQIRSDLVAQNKAGVATVRAMALVRASDWVDQEMVNQLLGWLDRPSEPATFAALTLGSLGNRAAQAQESLWKLQRLSTRDENLHSYQVVFGFARSKVDREGRQKTMREMLHYIGKEQALNHTDLAAMLNVAWSLGDEEFIGELVRTLDEEDPKARLGAIRMLEIVGMPAKKAIPALFKITKQNRSMGMRKAAFRALGTMLDYSRFTELKNCLKEEKSDTVQGGIEEALKLLNLEQ